MWRPAVVTVFLTFAHVLVPSSASATSCALDPDDPPLTIRQMIVEGTTGDRGYPRLMLGRVVAIRDLQDGPYDDQVAKLKVWAHPTGWTPEFARVRFRTSVPGDAIVSGELELRFAERYAIVGRRLADGSYAHDQPCGSSRGIWLEKMRNLLRLARVQDG